MQTSPRDYAERETDFVWILTTVGMDLQMVALIEAGRKEGQDYCLTTRNCTTTIESFLRTLLKPAYEPTNSWRPDPAFQSLKSFALAWNYVVLSPIFVFSYSFSLMADYLAAIDDLYNRAKNQPGVRLGASGPGSGRAYEDRVEFHGVFQPPSKKW